MTRSDFQVPASFIEFNSFCNTLRAVVQPEDALTKFKDGHLCNVLIETAILCSAKGVELIKVEYLLRHTFHHVIHCTTSDQQWLLGVDDSKGFSFILSKKTRV